MHPSLLLYTYPCRTLGGICFKANNNRMKNIKSGAMHYLFKMWEKVSPRFCCFILLCKERKGRGINNPVEGTRNDQFSILKFFSNLNLNGFMSPKPNRIKRRIAPEITRWFGFYDFTFFILFIFCFLFLFKFPTVRFLRNVLGSENRK